MQVETNILDRSSLYSLSWSYAQDGKLAVDTGSGLVVDANPASEAMMGRTREELIGMHITMLHPASERERVLAEFRQTARNAASHSGFHIQHKDGHCIPVAIWSSETLELGGRTLAIVELRDISDERQKEHQLSVQNWALSAFSIAALALGRAQSAESLQQSICEAITGQSTYVLAWIGIAEDGAEKRVRIAASAGHAVGYLDGLSISWLEDEPHGQGPVGLCIRKNTLEIVEDTETSPIFVPWRDRARRYGIRSCACIPLRIQGSWHGTLNVYSAHPNAFESAPVEVFERLAEQVAHGIQAMEHKQQLEAERRNLEKTQKHLTSALEASVSAMVTAMEMRDPYTAGHENRVAEIAYAIGKKMGWTEDRLEGLRMAAMVHDIGKISIPTEILNKPGRLTAAEYELVKIHPETGYTILKDIPFNWPIADIVRQHHEKLNGSGYPLGLKGSAILPESKVLAVADIVEAMVSRRPYRPAQDVEVALKEIERQAGTLLDEEVVRVCAVMFREKGMSFAEAQRN